MSTDKKESADKIVGSTGGLETPNTPTFSQAVRSNAAFLLANYNDLSEAEAGAIADKLDVCAELIERLELQNEELLLILDGVSNAK